MQLKPLYFDVYHLVVAPKKLKAIYLDMDNTLHSFSQSSGKAMSEVYNLVQSRYNVPIEKLKDVYKRIMQRTEENAFFDGRTSTEYRTERFTDMLRTSGVKNLDIVPNLLDVYSRVLIENTKPFDKTHKVLDSLSKRFKLYIITEGPSDAQRKVVDLLDLAQYIEDIFISGEAKKIKSNGNLFRYALKVTKHDPREVVHVGDSYKRDIVGASKAGLGSIWLNSKNEKLKWYQIKPLAQISDIQELGKLETLLKHNFRM